MTSDSHSPCRTEVCYYAQQQLIEVKEIQNGIRHIIKGPQAGQIDNVDPPDTRALVKKAAAAAALLDYIDTVHKIGDQLTALNEGAGTIFKQHYNDISIATGKNVPRAVCRLFEQVGLYPVLNPPMTDFGCYSCLLKNQCCS